MQLSALRRTKRVAAFAGIITLTLAIPGMAFAQDGLQAEDEGGDTLTNQGSVQKVLDFGEVCAGSTTSLDVILAVVRDEQGGAATQYDGGATVELSSSHTVDASTVATDAALTPGPAPAIVLPDNWFSEVEDGTESDPSTSPVAFDAGTVLGTFLAELRYAATGDNAHNGNDLTTRTKFDVTATVVHCIEMRGAPAIANEYLRDRANIADCKDNLGTNKNKSNWHGQLISAVAHEFEGTTFTEAEVHAFVEEACTG